MEQRDSQAPEMSAALNGDDMLGSAVALARNFAQQLAFAPDDQARLCILAEELVANLADHGTPGPVPPHLHLALADGAVRLVLTDSGQPFDPRTALATPPREDRGGGAGLAIVRAWADILDYHAGPAGNRLDVRLPLSRACRPPARSGHQMEPGAEI
jgi:anti-sigma regulatory factor (Ser/Thr protein kinase)